MSVSFTDMYQVLKIFKCLLPTSWSGFEVYWEHWGSLFVTCFGWKHAHSDEIHNFAWHLQQNKVHYSYIATHNPALPVTLLCYLQLQYNAAFHAVEYNTHDVLWPDLLTLKDDLATCMFDAKQVPMPSRLFSSP